jgi:hypothetical protein
VRRSHIKLAIEMPDELLGAFMQHIRDFDVKHWDDVLVAYTVDAAGAMKLEEIEAVFASIKPPFDYQFTVRKSGTANVKPKAQERTPDGQKQNDV